MMKKCVSFLSYYICILKILIDLTVYMPIVCLLYPDPHGKLRENKETNIFKEEI